MKKTYWPPFLFTVCRVSRLPVGVNCMILWPLVLAHYQCVMDGWTDRHPPCTVVTVYAAVKWYCTVVADDCSCVMSTCTLNEYEWMNEWLFGTAAERIWCNICVKWKILIWIHFQLITMRMLVILSTWSHLLVTYM